MSDDEELCFFGTPLDPLEEDEVPAKKISIEDQIVTDSNGRRRFHGAFTGGFSAGFWNTVGSLEGWKPQNFKSSRTEKAKQLEQKPTDFMDDEDLGEYGIAPQRIQTKDDFLSQDTETLSSRKRKMMLPSKGPIPGVPVLHQLLKPAKETVVIRLLKQMGWKCGQGVGARQTRKEKKVTKERNARERYLMKKYGVEFEGPSSDQKLNESETSEDDDDNDEEQEITFAPDDFESFECAVKNNVFGLGYDGLNPSATSFAQHIDLFGNAFEIMGKSNRKLSIRGQAFGVGALEEEDEDIYARDDMTKYDFTLEDGKKKSKPKIEEKPSYGCIQGFCSSKDNFKNKEVFKVILSNEFKPRDWTKRKTRFEPLDEQKLELLRTYDNEHKIKSLGRHDIDPKERGNILEKRTKENNVRGDQKKKEKINECREITFEKSGDSKKDTSLIEEILIKPDGDKVELPVKGNFYKPFPGIISDKFISESTILAEKEATKTVILELKKIEIVRTKDVWKPCGQLCKRFNIAEPFVDDIVIEKKKSTKKSRFSIFDYLETTKQNNFVPSTEVSKENETSLLEFPQKSKEVEVNKQQIELNKEIVVSSSQSKNPNLLTTIELLTKENIDTVNIESDKAPPKNNYKQKPKTELEKKIEESKNKHLSEKKDIFKAIFEDSNDEEDENTEEQQQKTREIVLENDDRATILNSSNISENVYTALTKSATELNIFRNEAPPAGIFANLLFKKPNVNSNLKLNSSTSRSKIEKCFEKQENQKDFIHKEDSSESDNHLMYGPQLPIKKVQIEPEQIINVDETDRKSNNYDVSDQHVSKMLKKANSSKGSKKVKVIEEWVEDSKIKKSKKKKKEKKSKKHKKHKKHSK